MGSEEWMCEVCTRLSVHENIHSSGCDGSKTGVQLGRTSLCVVIANKQCMSLVSFH